MPPLPLLLHATHYLLLRFSLTLDACYADMLLRFHIFAITLIDVMLTPLTMLRC